MKNFTKIVYTSKKIESSFVDVLIKHISCGLKRICGWSNNWIEFSFDEERDRDNTILKVYMMTDKKCSTEKIDELLLGKFEMSKTMI